jgi:hypothetical protein
MLLACDEDPVEVPQINAAGVRLRSDPQSTSSMFPSFPNNDQQSAGARFRGGIPETIFTDRFRIAGQVLGISPMLMKLWIFAA